MHIGLIGGIGPAATVVYYQRLTALMRERGRKLELTIVQASADELIENNLADNREAQAAVYGALIDRLKAAGAECAAITSLGGHFCFDETEAVSSLPLISGVTPLDEYFCAEGLGTVGLLGTRIVMQTGLYGQLKHTKAVAPGVNDMDRIADAYLDMALNGHCPPESRDLFFKAGAQMIRDQRAEAIILAGTDLGLAFDGHDTGYKVVDALDVHVALLADIACGDVGLN